MMKFNRLLLCFRRKTVLSFMVFWMVFIGIAVAPAQKAMATTPGPWASGYVFPSSPSPSSGAGQPVVDAPYIAIDLVTFTIRIGETSVQLGLIGEIISLIVNIYKLTQDLFGKLFDKIALVAKIMLEGQKIQTEVNVRNAQSFIDTHTASTRMRAGLEFTHDHVMPKHEYLCKAIMIHQLATTTKDFEKAVSRLAEKAIESMYRGPRENGAGPQYFADSHALRCLNKFGSPVDGYPSECIDHTDVSGETGARTFADADLSAHTLDGAVTLEVPVFVQRTIPLLPSGEIKVIYPDPQNYNQRMWVAGLNYCFMLAGPRPSPKWGEAMESETGKRERAVFNQGMAMQSVYNTKCTDLLAYYTRPNATMTALRNAQNTKCSAIKGATGDGLFTRDAIEKQFDNCEKGLSPYQSEYLEHALCKSPNHFLAQAMSGSNHFAMTDAAISCSAAWNAWLSTVASKEGGIVDGVKGLQEVKKVWSGMGGRHGVAGQSFPTGYEYVSDMMSPPQQKPRVHAIKAPQTGKEQAKEAEWPSAIEQ